MKNSPPFALVSKMARTKNIIEATQHEMTNNPRNTCKHDMVNERTLQVN